MIEISRKLRRNLLVLVVVLVLVIENGKIEDENEDEDEEDSVAALPRWVPRACARPSG